MKIENTAPAPKPQSKKKATAKFTTTVVVETEIPIAELHSWDDPGGKTFSGSTTEELAAWVQKEVTATFGGKVGEYVGDMELMDDWYIHGQISLDVELIPGDELEEPKTPDLNVVQGQDAWQ